MNKDSKIIRRIQDSRFMKALKDADVSKSAKFISTKQCKKCRKDIPIHEEICPVCKAQNTNMFISLLNGVAIAFFILGFFMPRFWLFSIASILFLIAVNKVKSKFPDLT